MQSFSTSKKTHGIFLVPVGYTPEKYDTLECVGFGVDIESKGFVQCLEEAKKQVKDNSTLWAEVKIVQIPLCWRIPATREPTENSVPILNSKREITSHFNRTLADKIVGLPTTCRFARKYNGLVYQVLYSVCEEDPILKDPEWQVSPPVEALTYYPEGVFNA